MLTQKNTWCLFGIRRTCSSGCSSRPLALFSSLSSSAQGSSSSVFILSSSVCVTISPNVSSSSPGSSSISMPSSSSSLLTSSSFSVMSWLEPSPFSLLPEDSSLDLLLVLESDFLDGRSGLLSLQKAFKVNVQVTIQAALF